MSEPKSFDAQIEYAHQTAWRDARSVFEEARTLTITTPEAEMLRLRSLYALLIMLREPRE